MPFCCLHAFLSVFTDTMLLLLLYVPVGVVNAGEQGVAGDA